MKISFTSIKNFLKFLFSKKNWWKTITILILGLFYFKECSISTKKIEAEVKTKPKFKTKQHESRDK